jgi:hypothetical protein
MQAALSKACPVIEYYKIKYKNTLQNDLSAERK